MKYLLDTHYVLWSLFFPEKINKKIKQIFENDEDIKIVSDITFWEISLKYSIGKLELSNTNPEEIYDKVIESGFVVDDVDTKIMISYYQLPLKSEHKDPFDRLLIWQSIMNDYTFITADRKIEDYVQNGLKIENGT